VDDKDSAESTSPKDERVISELNDDVDVTSPTPPTTTMTIAATKSRQEPDKCGRLAYSDYCKPELDRPPAAYLPLPFHYGQRPPTAEERLLLPLVHSILLQRHHQQQMHFHGAPAALSAALKLGSLDAAAVTGATQTSPAGPVGARVDVSVGAAAAAAAAMYPCAECGRAYSTASNLARHRQSHRSTVVGAQRRYEQQQRRSASPDRRVDPAAGAGTGAGAAVSAAAAAAASRKCPHCDKVYASAPAYSMHVRTHSQGCECPQCGKRFSRPWLLQGHIRTHTGEKPFRCPHCGKTFADKSNLRAHIQTHSTDKPHVCGRCGKAFALRSYLYKHEESSCMRTHRLYHGYAYLHHHQHHQQLHHHQEPQHRRQPPRQMSSSPPPVLRTAAATISQIPCQL